MEEIESFEVDVIIATPGKQMCRDYVVSLIPTIEFLKESGISYLWVTVDGSFIPKVRRELIEKIKDIDYKKIFWIDADISWSLDQFKSIYFSNLEILSGTYLSTNGDCVSSSILNKRFYTKQDLAKYEDNEVIEVYMNGFGFMCITKKAMYALENPFMPLAWKNNDICSEDSSWCIRMQEIGYSIWMKPSVIVDHYKTVRLD